MNYRPNVSPAYSGTTPASDRHGLPPVYSLSAYPPVPVNNHHHQLLSPSPHQQNMSLGINQNYAAMQNHGDIESILASFHNSRIPHSYSSSPSFTGTTMAFDDTGAVATAPGTMPPLGLSPRYGSNFLASPQSLPSYISPRHVRPQQSPYASYRPFSRPPVSNAPLFSTQASPHDLGLLMPANQQTKPEYSATTTHPSSQTPPPTLSLPQTVGGAATNGLDAHSTASHHQYISPPIVSPYATQDNSSAMIPPQDMAQTSQDEPDLPDSLNSTFDESADLSTSGPEPVDSSETITQSETPAQPIETDTTKEVDIDEEQGQLLVNETESEPVATEPTTSPRPEQDADNDEAEPNPEDKPTASKEKGDGSTNGVKTEDGQVPEKFFCHLCPVSATSKLEFDDHLRSHYEHRCALCDYTSRTEGRLQKHIKDFHSEVPPVSFSGRSGRTPGRSGRPKVYRCKQCPYLAPTKEDFWNHQRSNHIKEEKLLCCPKCPFVTEYKHHLEYHLRNHFGSKPFKCPKCNYQCVNKSMLNSHMKSHTNVYQYRCADCSYASKYCHSLKLHLQKHNHRPATVLSSDGSVSDSPTNLVLPGVLKPEGIDPVTSSAASLQFAEMAALKKLAGGAGAHPPGLAPMGDQDVAAILAYWSLLNSRLQQNIPLTTAPPFNLVNMLGGAGPEKLPPPQWNGGLLTGKTPPLGGSALPPSSTSQQNTTSTVDPLEPTSATGDRDRHKCSMCPFYADSFEVLSLHLLKAHADQYKQDIFKAFGLNPTDPAQPQDTTQTGGEASAALKKDDEQPMELNSSEHTSDADGETSSSDGRKSHDSEGRKSHDPHGPPPTKRPRKGKAYKLETICQRLSGSRPETPSSTEPKPQSTNGAASSTPPVDTTTSGTPDSGAGGTTSSSSGTEGGNGGGDPSAISSSQAVKSEAISPVAGQQLKSDTGVDGLTKRTTPPLAPVQPPSTTSKSTPQKIPESVYDVLPQLARMAAGLGDPLVDLPPRSQPGASTDVKPVVELKKNEQVMRTLQEALAKNAVHGFNTDVRARMRLPLPPQHQPHPSLLGKPPPPPVLGPPHPGLSRSMLNRMYAAPDPREGYHCRFCDITFGNCVMHSIHMGYHGYNDPFECNRCGHQAKDPISFFLHIARSAHPH